MSGRRRHPEDAGHADLKVFSFSSSNAGAAAGIVVARDRERDNPNLGKSDVSILVEAVAVFVRVEDVLRMVGGIELAPHEDRNATKRIRFIQKTKRLENISSAKSEE